MPLGMATVARDPDYYIVPRRQKATPLLNPCDDYFLF